MVTMGFISAATGGYYDGDQADALDLAVPPRPDASYAWRNGAWAKSPAALCAAVDAFREARRSAGFADATTGKTYQCDDASLTKWDALGSAAGLALVMATNPAPQFTIIAADNSTVTLGPADTYALLAGRVMPWVSATFLYGRTMKNAILAGNAPADITTGWP
jgi:hypothetical protein